MLQTCFDSSSLIITEVAASHESKPCLFRLQNVFFTNQLVLGNEWPNCELDILMYIRCHFTK